MEKGQAPHNNAILYRGFWICPDGRRPEQFHITLQGESSMLSSSDTVQGARIRIDRHINELMDELNGASALERDEQTPASHAALAQSL